MKKYKFEFEQIHETEKGFFIVQALTKEEAIRQAVMLNPNVTLVSEEEVIDNKPLF
jgi:hypothetical protein